MHRTAFSRLRLAPLVLTIVLGGCATEVPKPAAPPPPPPPPAAPPPSAPVDWRDLPLSAGGWRYAVDAAGSSAIFGAGDFKLACLKAKRQIHLARNGAATALTIRTSYGSRRLPAVGGVATLAAGDPLLDQIAFSRGRFSVEAAGLPLVMMPAWAEPARVIEDCRS